MDSGAAERTVEKAMASGNGGKSLSALALSPVIFCFLILSLYMVWLVWLGSPLNGDADDLIKLHELRTFIATGNVFDRTLPGIAQPEPYVSHWPWIVDLPYALVAWPLAPVLGGEPALAVASYAVPLILLFPALYCYGRLLTATGFNGTILPLFVAAIVAAASFFEFAPHRIDYHNLQILLFFAALVLVLSPHRLAPLGNGLLVALALAISFEFAVFHALVMGVYAFDFVFGAEGASVRLRNFGAGLAAGALLLLAVTVPPSAYAIGRCDTYSAPYALALVLAGSVFAGLPALGNRAAGWPARALLLCGAAVASAAVVLALYPQCAGGPYGEMSERLREVALGHIAQERSFFQRPDFVLSDSLPATALLFVGALAPLTYCLAAGRRDRPLVVVALVSLLALVQTIAYFRYLRYLPLFSGIGLVFVAAALLPQSARGILTGLRFPGRWPLSAMLLALPGLCVTGALVLFCLAAKPRPMEQTVFDPTGFCGPVSAANLAWPTGSIVMAPPMLGADLLAQPSHPRVVAVPNHHSAHGIDRADRFFDPAADGPRRALDESRATHVVLCAAPAGWPPAPRDRFPFAAALMEGRAPVWLSQCPPEAASPLRIYAYRQADGVFAACPLPAASRIP